MKCRDRIVAGLAFVALWTIAVAFATGMLP